MNLVIDQGNTICKLAVFDTCGDLISTYTVEQLSREYVESSLVHYTEITSVIYSSVGPRESNALDWLSEMFPRVMELTSSTPVPLSLDYDRSTLGSDRLAVAVGAKFRLFGQSTSALVIDAGTAITYEYVDKAGVYRGGNIAPGLYLRLKGLHQFTSRLPLIEGYPDAELDAVGFGQNTQEAMMRGALRGLLHEINGYIAELRRTDPGGVVFLTGGDAEVIAPRLDSEVIIAPDLVLEGLNHILVYNEDYVG